MRTRHAYTPRELESAPPFDSDGYPTEEALVTLEQWDQHDINGALNFARELWSSFGSANDELSEHELALIGQEGGSFIRFATGGWSGNESVIQALRDNTVVWHATWQLTARGGLHIFKYQSY